MTNCCSKPVRQDLEGAAKVALYLPVIRCKSSHTGNSDTTPVRIHVTKVLFIKKLQEKLKYDQIEILYPYALKRPDVFSFPKKING